jgi:hypothetical protein
MYLPLIDRKQVTLLFGLLGLSLEKERYFSLMKFDSILGDSI